MAVGHAKLELKWKTASLPKNTPEVMLELGFSQHIPSVFYRCVFEGDDTKKL